MRDFAPDAGDGDRFAVSPQARLLRLKDRAALFCARRQQLFALNETAQRIWQGLAAGQTTAAVAAHLEQLGLGRAEARAYVEAAADDWAREGHIVRAEAVTRAAEPPAGIRRLAVDGFPLALRLHGEVAVWQIEAAFGHLASESAGQGAEISIIEQDGRHILFAKGAARGETDAEGLIPALKALITELYAASVSDGFLVHGALLRSGRGETLFLTGEPGAGKTTLTLALAAAGWAYGGDDIVRISPDGLARAAPFAAAAKAGAWELLGDRLPDLTEAPVHRRADGQSVRYVLPAGFSPLRPAPIDRLLVLRRRPGAEPGLEPLHPLDALVVLLDSAFSRRGAADGAALTALAARLETCACHTFTYSGLDDAVAALGAQP